MLVLQLPLPATAAATTTVTTSKTEKKISLLAIMHHANMHVYGSVCGAVWLCDRARVCVCVYNIMILQLPIKIEFVFSDYVE